jgi:hypothetical protein
VGVMSESMGGSFLGCGFKVQGSTASVPTLNLEP